MSGPSRLINLMFVLMMVLSLLAPAKAGAVEEDAPPIYSRDVEDLHLGVGSGLLGGGVSAIGQLPEPLPTDCDGVAPPGGSAPACCVYGYVYYDGVPVTGASVRIESNYGALDVTTEDGSDGSEPHYGADLSSSPLLVSPGDSITITATYYGSSESVAYQAAPGGQQVDMAIVVNRVPLFGDGSDGDLVVSGTYYTDDVRAALSGNASAGQKVLNLTSVSGFSVGDEVLVIQMQGTGAGIYELGIIVSVETDSLLLQQDLQNNYFIGGTSKAQILRVSNYQNVTVQGGGVLTAHAWDGDTGGIVAIACSGKVAIQDGGMIDVGGKGFRGGTGSSGEPDCRGVQGEGQIGPGGAISLNPNGAGGGGGGFSDDNHTAGGGGGAYGSNGGRGGGFSDANGLGGLAWGQADMAICGFGGGGGSGSQSHGGQGTAGGAGGGLAILAAKEIEIDGTAAIDARGDGGIDNTIPGYSSAGGGGGGGGIRITSRRIDLDTLSCVATGGSGGIGDEHSGGDGGNGRIRIEYSDVLTGTTSPAASTEQRALHTGPIVTIQTIYPSPAAQGEDTITFRGSAVDNDEDGASITQYVWRSNLDGVLSTQDAFTLPAVDLSAGTHTIYLKARDDEGEWSAEIARILNISGAQGSAPEASFAVDPSSGDTTTVFNLDASGCHDNEDAVGALEVRWDWEDDGAYDTGWSTTKTITHTYTVADNYTIRLEVRDTDGMADTATGQVTVNPAGSSPPTASISFIYPNPAVQGQDTIYFNGSGQDTDQGGAYITAYTWNSSSDGQLSTQEDFTVQASELSAGAHTIAFKVQDDEGEWSQDVTRTLTVQAVQVDVRTLILVNRQMLEDLYSVAEADQVMDKLNALAAHDSVKGLVVQLENDAAVATAYAAWGADLTSTAKANDVTGAIKALLGAQWAGHPDLEYLVIVGDDRVIPFRRVLDQTRHPESKYKDVSCSSVTGAALCDDMSLTDDYYADAAPTVPDSDGWDGHALYIPDLGTGRLIETPAEIIGQIDTFLAGDGVTVAESVVTGYDFLQDAAQAVCSVLNGDGVASDCTLIGESWTAGQAIDRVLNTYHHLVSFNGHANHSTFGTPSGYVSSNDIVDAATNHSRALFYTVGCHSGLNVPPTNPYQPLDVAQALVQHQANYVANTGFGWGYRTSIGLSEQLMLDFTERLVFGQSATVGQALAAAKQEYYLEEGDFDFYDEKIMIESALYGLPMYRYTTPATAVMGKGIEDDDQGDGVIKEEQMTLLGDGLTVNSISYQFPALLAESTDDGRYYTFGGAAHAGDGEPIQPKYVADLSFPQTEGHGIVFKGGLYADILSFNPVVDRAITETATLAEPTFSAPGWYPPLVHRFNRLERGDKLVTLLGQYNTQDQTERMYDQLTFDVYYHTSSDDWTAPKITGMSSELVGGEATISVQASDGSGIEAVVIAYTNGAGAWESVSLTEDGERWTGSFAAGAGTEFFVQVVDRAGNVVVNENNGRYFKPGEGSQSAIYLPLVLTTP